MKKFAVAVLLLTLCAAPAFAVWPFSKKHQVHKNPRATEHPKSYHQKNEHYKQAHRPKATKHNPTHK